MTQLLLLIAVTSGIPDGSVVVKDCDHSITKFVTGSRICHTAMIFNHNGVPWVYEAYPPHVRAMPWEDYKRFVWKQIQDDSSLEMWVMQPRQNYSSVQVYYMLHYAQSELGRRYGVRSYALPMPTRRIDCSEYTTRMLIASGRFQSSAPWQVSPGCFYQAIAPYYFPAQRVLGGTKYETQRFSR